MAYSIQLPDGTLVQDIPDEVPEDVARQQIYARHPELPRPGGKTAGVWEGLKRGASNYLSDFGTGIEGMFGGQEGANRAAKAGLEEQHKRSAADSAKGVISPTDAIKDAYNKHGIAAAVGQFARTAPETIAENAAPIAVGLGGARTGAMVGTAIAPFLGPAAPAAPIVGAVGGGALALYPSMFGANTVRQAEVQQAANPNAPVNVDRTNAAVAAGAQTALGELGPAAAVGGKFLSKVLGIGGDVIAKQTVKASAALVAKAEQSLSGAVASGVVRGAATDMPASVAQAILTRAQAGQSLTDADAMNEYGTTLLQTGAVSPLMGTVGRLHERGAAQDAVTAMRNQQAAEAAAKQQTAEAAAAAQAAAQKSDPNYLRTLDKQYQDFLAQDKALKAQIAARGKPPSGGEDPSAVLAHKAAVADLAKQAQELREQNAQLIQDHAEVRPAIDALRMQDKAAAEAQAQAQQGALETADPNQPTANTPVYTGEHDPNAQPDLFGEGNTPTQAAQAPVQAEAVPLEMQLQQASQALANHENAIDALRNQVKEAHAQNDLPRVVQLSAQANDLAKQTKPLQDALEKLKSQHAPTVAANLEKIKKALALAVENGDTEKTAKLAAKIQELQQNAPQQGITEAIPQNQARDTELATQMADGRERAAKVTSEVEGIKGLAENDAAYREKQRADSEAALAQRNAEAKESRNAPKPEPEYAQQDLLGEADTADNALNARTEDLVGRVADTLVDPDAAANEQTIRELKREQAQHIATLNGLGEVTTPEQAQTQRESTAKLRELQTRIAELESKGRVNPRDADAVDRADALHKQLEQANNDRESARAVNDAPKAEEAALRAKKIADQLAQAQQEPGSFIGRLVKAKNDVSQYLTAFFDAAHEIHTSGIVPILREKLRDVGMKLRELDNRPQTTPAEIQKYRAAKDELTRQAQALDRQLGALNGETNPKKLAIMARQAIRKYVRAAFREENIRREARGQKPLTGEERAAFADKATRQAEAILTRAAAERGGDAMEEHVIEPAQMRSGKVVKGAVTEWRDSRPLEERPFAKFGPARAVEEETFHQERADSLQSKQKPTRVEGGILKRQWAVTEAKRTADERGENATTVTGQQRRRAEYLTNQLDAMERDTPTAAGERFALQPLRDALEEFPTNNVMDAVEPLVRNARAGVMPNDIEMNGVREAVALEREVADNHGEGRRIVPRVEVRRAEAKGEKYSVEGDSLQRNLFDPQTAVTEQGRIEDKQAANEARAGEIDKATYKTPEDAAKALKEKEALGAANERLEKDRQAAKDDERALKGEAERTATSFERTTPARFANAPEVKAGRAAADEQARLVADIHDQLEAFAADDAKPSWFSELSKRLADVKQRLADFKANRPFAGMGRMEKRELPKLAEKDGLKVSVQDSADIIFQLASYNKFVDETNAFLAKHRGTDTPEYKRLTGELENLQRAISSLPSDAELVAARRTLNEQRKVLDTLLAKPEPAKPAGKAARARNIESARQAVEMAERILRLKETTSTDISAPARKAEREETAQQAAKRRADEAVAEKQRSEVMDKAVEERMRLDEAARRLAKLPTTIVSRNSEITDAIRVGLNREASGIRAKLDLIEKMRAEPDFEAKAEKAIKDAIAAGKPALVVRKMKSRLADARTLDKSDAGLRKWQELLKNSERNLTQLEDVAPRSIKERGEPTSERDDIVPAAPLNKAVRDAAKIDVEKLPLRFETEADKSMSKRTKAKDTTAAEAAAEALNDKQVVGGRGVVTRKIGSGQGKVGVDRKRPAVSAKAAMDAGVVASAEKRAREIDANLENFARLGELNDARLEQAVTDGNKADIAKYTAYRERLQKATERLKKEYAPLDRLINKGVKRGKAVEEDVGTVEEGAPLEAAEIEAADLQKGATYSSDDLSAPNKPTAERASTPLSDDTAAAVKEGRLTDTLHDIARTSADPEAREAAAKLAPYVSKTEIGVTRNLTHNGETVAGLYTPEENRIRMHQDGLTEQDVLHESAHAATDGVMLADPATLTTEQRKARAGLEGMWNSVKDHPALEGEHATSSVREFVAEVFTNPEFRTKLDSMGKPLSLLARFKNFVRQMFGLPTSPSGKARDMVEKILSDSRKIDSKEAAPSLFRSKDSYASDLGKFGRSIAQNRSVVDDIKQAGASKLGLAMEQKIVDFRASLRRVAKLGDKQTGTQVLGDVLSADRQLGNLQAAASDGAFKLTKDSKGLIMMGAGGGKNAKDVAEAIGRIPGKLSADEKMDMFQAFMSGKRAQDVGWEKLSYDNPVGMEAEYKAAMAKIDAPTRAALERAQDVYHEMNKGLVKFLEETDTLPKELTDKMMADRNYIPFFRNRGDTLDMVMQDGSMRSVGDIRTLPFLHALNGDNGKVMPFEQSLLKNIGMLTNLGVQNMTNRHIAYHLQGLGASAGKMQIREGKGTAGDNVMRFRVKPDPKRPKDDGERHLVIDTTGTAAEHIPSDLLAAAVAGSYTSVPSLLKVGAWASDLLRAGVTRMPTYVVSQLIKDPLNAAMMGNLKDNPLAATMKTMNNFQEYLRGNTPEGELMSRHGILHSNVFNGSKDDLHKIAMQLAGGNQSKYRQFLTKLDKIAMGADAATRVQAYRDILKSGGSELEAMIHAQEMQNFSKRGSSASLQMISRLTPFFNAQIQGLNVLAKSATGKMPMSELMQSKEAFFKRALGMSAIAVAAAAQLDEDPEWNRMTLATRMAHIPIPGTDLSIPAPFESGALFWSLPVAFVHALKNNYSSNDWQDVRRVLINNIPGNGSAMPQLAKGYLDVSRNYNSYFGTPIESPGMEKKASAERYTSGTPELMKAFSRQLNAVGVELSPVQIDYLAGAYLGQFPHMVAAATNNIFETKSQAKETGERPTGSKHDNPLLARFTTNPAESRNMNDAYDIAKAAGQTEATFKAMVKDGRMKEAAEYRKAQIAKYGTPESAARFTKIMGYYKRQIDAVTDNSALSGDAKQARIEQLYVARDKAAKDWMSNVVRQE